MTQQPKNVTDKQGYILLVEDEPANMAILSEYLRMSGFAVNEVADGKAAWAELATDSKYDLIVTDRRMPNMDGLELAKRIRNDKNTRDIPVIMQTGASSQEEILEGIRAGVYYYLAKPYEEDLLLSIVRAAIQERRQQQVFEQRMIRQDVAMRTFVSGEFQLTTLEESQNLALLLGGLFARPELAVSGLYELLLNAIEHGNLGIGYEKKNHFLAEGKWDEEVTRRLELPENKNKKISVQFARSISDIEVTITDAGSGFDWRPFMQIEPSRATQASGRGIAKAALLCFDKVEFIGKGNQVKIKSADPKKAKI